MEERLCSFCKKPLIGYQANFCSNSCTNSWRGKRLRAQALDEYVKNPKLCLTCSSPLLPKGNESISFVKKRKYCNSSCAASNTNKLYPKRNPEGICEICSAPISKKVKYCSKVCRTRSKYLNKVAKVDSLKELAKREGMSYPEFLRHKGSTSVVDYRKRMKLKAIEYKGGFCVICGYSRSVRALTFHHLDPRRKDFSISGKTFLWEKVKAELDKCVLVCSNCHAEIHDGLIELG